MLHPLSPLINTLSGTFNKDWVFRRRRHGPTVIARKTTHPGPEFDSPSMQWMQCCWNILDAFWRTLSRPDKLEWARCSPRVNARRVTGFIHFKTINLRRFMAGLSALRRPPDKFRNHLRSFPLKGAKVVRAWAGIEQKVDPGDPDPPLGPPPPPDNPCIDPTFANCPEHCDHCSSVYWSESPWTPGYPVHDFPLLTIPQAPPGPPPDFPTHCLWLNGPEIWWWDYAWEYKANFTELICIHNPELPDEYRAEYYIRVLHIPSMEFAYAIYYYTAPLHPAWNGCPGPRVHYTVDSMFWGQFKMSHNSSVYLLSPEHWEGQPED